MALAVLSWLVAIPLLGAVTGMRTMLAMAVVCWYAWFGHLPLADTWAFWAGLLPAAIIFSVLAVGELIGDKLPRTPDRISPFPLAARLVFGGLVGAIVATGLQGSIIEGTILGIIGATLGAFGGWFLRRLVVESTGWPDWRVAIIEDALAVVAALFALGIITG